MGRSRVINPRTKIKVERDLLIAAIEAKHAEEVGLYAAAYAMYPREVREYNAAYVKAAKAALTAAQSSPDPLNYYSIQGLVHDMEAIPAPFKPIAPRDITRVVKQLRMASDEVIIISVEDFEQYL